MKEAKEFLIKLGATSEDVEKFISGDATIVDNLFSSIQKAQRELYKNTEEYKKTISSVKAEKANEIERHFCMEMGIKDDDRSRFKVASELFAFGKTELTNKIKELYKGESDGKLVAENEKISKLLTEYDAKIKKLETEEIPKIKMEAENRIKSLSAVTELRSYIVNKYKNFTIPNEAVFTLIENDIKTTGNNIVVELGSDGKKITWKDADGSNPMTPDGTRLFEFNSFLDDAMKKYNLVAKSNGNDGSSSNISVQTNINNINNKPTNAPYADLAQRELEKMRTPNR